MTKQDLINEIYKLNSLDDLKAVNNAIRDHWKTINGQRALEAKFIFAVGQQVTFSGRHRGRVTGRITKINQVSADISEASGIKWRVNLSALKAVESTQPKEG